MFLSNVKEPYLVDRDGFEPPNPIGDVIYSHMVLTKLTHLSILEPEEGFEPPWDFSSCLRYRCNRPLCDSGWYSHPGLNRKSSG